MLGLGVGRLGGKEVFVGYVKYLHIITAMHFALTFIICKRCTTKCHVHPIVQFEGIEMQIEYDKCVSDYENWCLQ